MFNRKIFLFFLLSLGFLPFLAGCRLGARPLADWTFLVYLAADNNLDYYATLDLEEMMAVGSTLRLQIVVQHDPFSRGAPTRRYRVTKGRLVELARLGETNTGDEAVVEDFLAWGMQNFPARHYALVLWNHGSGVFDGFPPGQRGTAEGAFSRSQAVAIDWTAGNDALTTREYARALGRAVAAAGKRLDLLCFDACYMAMVEVAAEIAAGEGGPFAAYLVASEAAVPGAGLDYQAILSWLAGHSGADAAELASFIVDSYAATYASSWSQGVISCALCLGGEKWSLFLAALGQLAEAIATGDEGLKACAREAALAAYSFVDYRYPVNRDLLDFVRVLGEKATGYPAVLAITTSIQELLRPGEGLVLRVASTGPLAEKGLGGLAVFLPTSSAWWADYPDYSQLHFAALTGWDKAVAAVAGD